MRTTIHEFPKHHVRGVAAAIQLTALLSVIGGRLRAMSALRSVIGYRLRLRSSILQIKLHAITV